MFELIGFLDTRLHDLNKYIVDNPLHLMPREVSEARGFANELSIRLWVVITGCKSPGA